MSKYTQMSKPSKAHVQTALFCLAALVAARPSAIAQAAFRSQQATNGIYAEIGIAAGEIALPTSKVSYCFLTTNEFGTKIFYPKPEYFCRARLLDAHGSNMPPTALGRAMGKHFTDLKTFSRDKLQTTGGRGSDPVRPRFENIRSDSCAGTVFPTPEALFEIPGPGKYTLQLEFQVFQQVRQGTNYLYNLTILPAVDVPVIKPEGTKP
jgi:hypothetical protein